MNDTEDFAALLRQFEGGRKVSTKAAPGVGDPVQGQVVAITDEAVFIDLGGKTEGIMEPSGLLDADGRLTVAVGDPITARVASIDPESGQLRLGSQHGRRFHDTAELEQAYRQQLPVEGLVTGVTKGGIEVQIAGVRAFCPASQADRRFVEDLSILVGQHLTFRITKFEGGRHTNLVVSRRAVLEEEQRALADQTRARLEVGAVLQGTVTSLKDFGAFIDLGGIEGMIHVSELAFGRIKHPSELLSVGQPVEVSVLRIERGTNPKQPEKIALSIRALSRDPWKDVAERFPAGTRVTGQVTRVEPFGVFIELEPGIEGLVHVSELGAGRRISHPNEVVNVGDQVAVTILGIEPDKRRIALSLDAARQTEGPPGNQDSPAPAGPPKGGFGTLGDLLRASLAEKK